MRARGRSHLAVIGLALLLGLASVRSTSAAPPACTHTWTGGAGTTAWGTASNWSPPSVPGQTAGRDDHACIPDLVAGIEVVHSTGTTSIPSLQGAGGVQLSGGTLNVTSGTDPPSIARFDQSGGTLGGAGTLQIGTSIAWTGGTMRGTGKTVVQEGATLTRSGTASVFVADSRTLEVAGNFDSTADNSMFRSGFGSEPLLHVTATGALGKSAGTGSTLIDVALDNDGRVESLSGRLNLNRGAATPHGGTFSGASATARPVFAAGTHVLGTGAALEGWVEVNGGTVQVAAGVTVGVADELVLTSGELGGAGGVDVTGTLRWTGGGQRGPGTTAIAPTGRLDVQGCGGPLRDGRLLDNQGTARITGGGVISFAGTPAPMIENRGRIEIDGTGATTCMGTPGVFGTDSGLHNSGAIEKLGDSGAGWLHGLDNDGSVLVSAGDLRMRGQTTAIHTGSFSSTGAGSRITFDSGSFALAPGVSIAGAPVIQDAQLAIPSGMTLTIGSGTTLTQAGGTIAGDGTLRVTSTLVWADGIHTGTGTTLLEPGAQATVGDALDGSAADIRDDRQLVNWGQIALQGRGLQSSDGASILNAGTIETADEAGLDGSCAGCGLESLLHNAGLLRKSGVGTANFNVHVDNDGTIEATGGRLVLENLLNVATDDHTLAGGAYVVRDATLELRRPLEEIAARLLLDGSGAQVEWALGEGAPASNALAALGRIAGGGELELAGGRSLTTTRPLRNLGVVRIGPGSTLTASGAYRQYAGLTRLGGAGARLTATGAQVELAGGRLAGRGSAGPAVAVTAGAVEPGIAGAGVLAFDAFSAGSGAILRMRLAGPDPGTDFGQLEVTGAAQLGGTLAIDTDPAYQPTPGTEIPIVTYGSGSGTFATLTGTQPGGGVQYAPVYGPSDLKLRVQALGAQAREGESGGAPVGTGDTSATTRWHRIGSGALRELAVAPALSLSSVLDRGVPFTVACRRPCDVRARLLLDRRTARRLSMGRVVGRARSRSRARRHRLVAELTERVRFRLRPGRSLTLEVTAIDDKIRSGSAAAPVRLLGHR